MDMDIISMAVSKALAKEYTDSRLVDVSNFQYYYCSDGEYNSSTGVPTISSPAADTFYITPAVSGNNVFNVYIYKNKAWVLFKSASVDLSELSGEISDLKGDLNDRIDDVESQIDDLKYVPIAINSFSLSPATAEKGSTVATINFSYSFNKTPTTLKLGTENITPSGTSIQKTGLSVTNDTTYTLTATDSGSYSNPAASASKTATLHFYDKIHYGVASVPSAYNDSFLLTGLSNHDLASGKAKTFTVNSTSGKYIYFALPTAMGTPNFNVGGFDGGFTKAAEFSHTNASGYATTYAVYKSDNAGLGSTKVTVS